MRNQSLYNYLKAGHRVTRLGWYKVAGTMKLAARIAELRKDLYFRRLVFRNFREYITDCTVLLSNGKRVKQYWLEVDK